MPKQVIALEATLNSGPAEGSVKSLKAQLREAQAEVQTMSDKFGLTSVEAQKAARKAAELKDAIGDAKLLTDAFNPDAKFKSFSNAIQGVVGGFAALQGAQALFGSESEDVAKVLAKVQGAMALSQGINSVLEAKDAFKILGGVIKTNVVGAFSTLKGAIISTGIGALIVGIGLLIEQFSAMSDAADEAAESQKKLNEETKKFTDIGLKSELDYINRQEKLAIAKAKLAGKSEEDIFKIQQDFRAQRLRAQGRAYEEIKTADAKAAGELKNQIENGIVDGQTVEIENQVKLQDIRNKAAEERRQKQKEENDKLLEDLRNANAEQNNLQKQLQDEITLSLIEDERQREQVKLEMDLEKAKKDVENSKASTKEKNESIALLEQQYMINLRIMKDGFAKEDKDKADKEKEEKAKEDAEKLQREKDNYDKLIAGRKAAADESIAIAKAESEAKQGLNDAYLNSVSAGIGILKMFADKNKGLQKALLIAENGVTIARIILDTQRSIVQARASVAGIPPFLPGPVPIPNPKYILAQTIANANIAQSKIAAGIGIAQALAATAKGLSSIGGGGSAGGGGGINAGGGLSGGGGGGVSSPIQPQLSNTILNQQAINQQGNAAIRSYVVESDVAGNQERIERLNRAARIN
ncbi:hypothetical protein UFOVP215_31 [uncultured Caudovirales phage]|uniref:Uncharacterized protein n=1 Tax=uncultured Caudovirales phage TaxID=2100421 RepID=A0A6J7WRY4_9CAUD|nr:hypothetical protein UFOVP215_31 [uncultured Caudovirales phage]